MVLRVGSSLEAPRHPLHSLGSCVTWRGSSITWLLYHVAPLSRGSPPTTFLQIPLEKRRLSKTTVFPTENYDLPNNGLFFVLFHTFLAQIYDK